MLGVAILAGGLATRLRPLTETIPKCLVEVAGRPFAHWQLALLRDRGVRDVTFCLGHLGEQVEAEVGDGSRFGLRARYSYDGDRLLGTGGALRKALGQLGDPFFVLYGDSYLPIDLGAVQRSYEKSGRPALMTVLHNRDRWDRSNVVYRDGQVLEYDKRTHRPEMEYIDYGLGVLSGQLLGHRPARAPFELSDLYHALSLSGDLAGHEVHERFYEIGSHQGLRETEDHLRAKDPR